MKEKNNLPLFFSNHMPWRNQADPLWPATAFVLRRNLAAYPFPSKIAAHQVESLIETLKEILLSSTISNGCFLKSSEIQPISKEYLFEHFLCLTGFQNALQDQGFVVEKEGKFLACLNIEDHLQLRFLDFRGEWEKSWQSLSNLENAISQQVDFAYSSKFGYLTSDLSCCGTGLTVLVYLHLPALLHATNSKDLLLHRIDEGVVACGLDGSLEEIIGDLVIFSNKYTLGLSEENILHSLHLCAMKFIALEKKLRSQLKEDNHKMKDLVSRAYGLLIHSFELETKEALNALSLLKLGVDLNWIKGIGDEKINEMFFLCRRAHLTYFLNKQAEDLLRKRAEYVHKQLQGIELLI